MTVLNCASPIRWWPGWLAFAVASLVTAAERPNFVFILADDLGYGDVRCLNPAGKIATPQLDRLAAEGMVFTDAHSSSAVCTPTRYSILTGRYNWRSRLQQGVLGGLSPRLIEPDRLTVAAFMRNAGYATACIGKWHLGLDWTLLPGKKVSRLGIESAGQHRNVDFTQPFRHGPTTLGFDYFFGISASLDMVPYTFLENDRVTRAPTEDLSFPMKPEADGQTRRGPGAPGFQVEDVLPTLTARAVAYIDQHAADARQGRPFFLYLPLNAPHTPIAPNKEWRGKSGVNSYADFVMQTDASVGEVLAALDRNRIASNTFAVFASDNGCSPSADFKELAAKGHNPSQGLRGMKADIFEGGHRIPFLVRWPGHVKSGSKSDQLVCLMDFMATVADALGEELPANAAEDSFSLLPVLLGRSDRPVREALVHHSINGSFAIRQGNWKLELCLDSGGWSDPKPGSPEAKRLPDTQLYNLADDIAEQHNLADQHPEIVTRLTKLLERYVADGRSTPGPVESNTVPVTLRKQPKARNGKK